MRNKISPRIRPKIIEIAIKTNEISSCHGGHHEYDSDGDVENVKSY